MSRPALERAEVDPPTSAFRWIACGDSFTAGLEPGGSWTDIVAAELGPDRPAELTNVAVAGATAAMVEADQLPWAVAAGPDLVSLICGGNDVIGAVRPRPHELAADLGRAFGRLAAELPDAQLLTATYPPIAADALRPRTRRRISQGMEALNEVIREAADRAGFTCVELHDHPGRADRSNYAADGIHPSPAGQRAAATVLGPVIETLMNDDGNATDIAEEEQ